MILLDKRTEATSHQLFLLTVVAKGLLGLFQLATAAAIVFGATQQLPKFAEWVFKAELSQDPKDFLATKIMSLAGSIPQADLSFYTAYFTAHGALHIGVVAALLYGAKWADIAAIAILAAFVVYQVFEWFSIGGGMLVLLTVIDLVVIYLTVLEMRRKTYSNSD
ncbi:hypothetical protein DSM110277_01450 [Sulfitobacter pontiacus]|uniref:DUF2127 domain-containing protein n=1 Tax=Sulfitobacter pontiacus TaxID=60137 RepID=A0AAX3AAY7_9RHOB|nr:DUF2127 domain-containing protein [Sulfitobacter pontiacus]UOA23038.1 hypothetical protein DSM110277_01450 [Sulfitobacter pontiacus]WPZ24038.1 DUF2127 domain-containing protein [Sulfitobacter pontiacus]